MPLKTAVIPVEGNGLAKIHCKLIGEQAPLESLLGAEGLSRLGAMVAVDEDGVLQGVVTLAQVRRALRPAAI